MRGVSMAIGTAAGAASGPPDLALQEDRHLDDRRLSEVELAAAPRWECVARRALDLLGAGLGLALTWPLLLLACLLVVLESPGWPLYGQRRVGLNGRSFRLLKLRTMVPNAEADGHAVWASDPDPRVTRVGALLRRSHLDEVPQLWNVLRGQMSLVGPRPERPEFVEQLRLAIPDYDLRHLVRPGLTGLAQVNYGYGASLEGAAVKLGYDLAYVKQRSLGLDLQILGSTLLIQLGLRRRGEAGRQVRGQVRGQP
jgi:lipopolysaccharide/colanic/teichoic acid biosynthesis glycosyltransferase